MIFGGKEIFEIFVPKKLSVEKILSSKERAKSFKTLVFLLKMALIDANEPPE